MKIEIRKAILSDASDISKLIIDSTQKNPNNYSIAQQNAWIAYNSEERISSFIENRDVFCLMVDDLLKGTISLEYNEIQGFYVQYEGRGQGYGVKLLDYAEEFAISKDYECLILSSTPSAEGFYQKQGFQPMKVF